MTRAFRRERKLCWPSCCFLAWGTVSFYIFLTLLPDSLTKTTFLRKKEIMLIETFSVHYQLSREHLWKGKAEGLRQRVFGGLNDPLKEDVRVWKASELLLVTSTWHFLLTSDTRASHSHPRASKECQRGGPRQKSVQQTCDAPDKHNFSLFTSTMTVIVLSRHKGIMHCTGLRHSWVLSVLQANKIKGWVVVMFYQHIIKSH